MPPTTTAPGPGALRHAMLFELLRQQNHAQEIAARLPGAGPGEAEETERFQILALRSLAGQR